MQIREFIMADYPAVYALWEHAGPGLVLRPSDQPDEVEKKLARDADLFLVAEEDGQVVGVIMGAWDGRRGWLHHLAVAEECRNRGIGTALLLEVEARLKAKGCLKVNLLIRRNNADAKRLYERLGYEEMSTVTPMGKEL